MAPGELTEEEVQLRFIDFYSKQTQAHATYFLTLIVALFVALQVIEARPSYEEYPPATILAALVLSALSTGMVANLLDALAWGAVSASAIKFNRFKPKEHLEKLIEKWPLLARTEKLIAEFAFDPKCKFQEGPEGVLPEGAVWTAKLAKAYREQSKIFWVISLVVLAAVYYGLLYSKLL